jgi:hypothetical protein
VMENGYEILRVECMKSSVAGSLKALATAKCKLDLVRV